MIPKIIHQIWLSSPVPDKFKNWSQTFPRQLPDWEHRVWNDDTALALIREKFPRYLETFSGLKSPVQKSDVLRYMVLCAFGGFYADMDCECRIPFDFIRDDDEFIVCTELETTSARIMDMYPTDLNLMYCQWAFLSRPQHPVLVNLLEEIHRGIDAKHSDNPILDFLKRTGPHAFTKALKKHLDEGGTAKILPPSFFGCCDTSSTFRFGLSFLAPELFRKVYVRHHFTGTWMDSKTKNKMLLRNLFFLPAGNQR